MEIWRHLVPFLGFRTAPTTILILAIYIVILLSVISSTQLPQTPKHQPNGLNITEAWADLQAIAAGPHPYNSHANDAVRAYLLARLRTVPGVKIIDDLKSNGSWAGGGYGTYFEGTNLLVKVKGTDPSLGAVLFSAHYDSVSTASGATDDGMGVVTLLQLIQYFAKNKGKRTAIFNINNGEEDWLNGAHAFMEHPWSNSTSTFLNLEGASSGGRPLLFRSTSRTPLASFRQNVPHPHANVLSADAFARGLIRSGTDYSVYTPSMQGLDLAFYTGRSRYHTKYDAVPYLEGAQGALWAMLESAWGAGEALLHAKKQGHGGDTVYFDLFANTMVMFSLKALNIFNIVFLVIVPIFVVYEQVVHQGLGQRWEWAWSRFWIALAFSIGIQVVLVAGYAWLNPYIVYSVPYAVVSSFLALVYITLFIPLRVRSTQHPEVQKQSMLLQNLILAYILLFLSTIFLSHIGGTYLVSAWAGFTFLAWAIGAVEQFLDDRRGRGERDDERNRVETERRLVRGIRYEVDEEDHGENGEGAEARGQEVETEPTEITPLIQQRRSQSAHSWKDQKDEGGWWIAQVLVAVPIPVILVAHVGVMLVGALAQTLGDGGGVVVVYAPIAILSTLLLLPAAPFMHKITKYVAYILAAIFLLIIIVTSGLTTRNQQSWGFPFSSETPLKVYFQQKVEILPSPTQSMSLTDGNVRLTTHLTGVSYYLERFVVPSLPSAAKASVRCGPETGPRKGLSGCSWASGDGMGPDPGEDDVLAHGDRAPATNTTRIPNNPWFSGSVRRLSRTSAQIRVKGVNTRSCRVYFDGPRVASYVVRGSSGKMQSGYEVEKSGLDELRLWSRTWGREFVVDVSFVDAVDSVVEGGEEGDGKFKGRLACEWAEYESGRVGYNSGRGKNVAGGRIPALEEVLKFLPRWAAVTKAADGLVEVWSSWEV